MSACQSVPQAQVITKAAPSSPPPSIQTSNRVTPPNSEERPMRSQRGNSELHNSNPSGGGKKPKARSKSSSATAKPRVQRRKNAKTVGQNKMKAIPASVSSHDHKEETRPPQIANGTRPTAATSEYPSVMGRPIMPKSGGVKFEFTHTGLVYKGRCDAKTFEYLESTDELGIRPLDCGAASVSAGETEQSSAPLHSSLRPQQRHVDELSMLTPRSLFALPLSPPPSVAQRASITSSPWYAQSMTPQRDCTVAPMMTPTSMPAVTTPKKLTDSAKAFADALNESSPLAMLASAAGMESYSVMKGPTASQGATPALVEAGSTPITSSAKKVMPSFPVSMPPMGNAWESKDDSPDRSKGITMKRYSIRPKEGCRIDMAAATANVAAVDLLFVRPAQHPSFFTASKIRAPRSTLPLLGGAKFTSGATA